MVRTRFAPSPTGYLHIGGVRTALFNWLFARRHGGQFILRIDDTDLDRNRPEALQPILDGFRWLGIDWDEGAEVGGPCGPYYQSERLDRYQAAVKTLLDKGLAYHDYATADELKLERETAEKEKRPFLYSRRWMAQTPADRSRFESEGRKAVVRLLMPRQGVCRFHDHIRGDMAVEWTNEADHVIQRADGSCLYNLANVVDDHDMRITHVIRAEEHLSNTPRQIFIARGLGYDLPEYAHVPFVAEPGSKNKLSKRKLAQYLKNPDFRQVYEHGKAIAAAIGLTASADTFNPVIVDFYRQVGYLPDAIVNYLLLLGWSLDDKTEFFMREEMIRHFSLERVTKSAASFDAKKLRAFQERYMALEPLERKTDLVLPFLQKAKLIPEAAPADVVERVTAIVRAAGERIKVAGDILDYDAFFLPDDRLIYDEKAFNQHVRKPSANALLRKLRDVLATATFEAKSLEDLLQRFAKSEGVRLDEVSQPLALAVTGKAIEAKALEKLAKEELATRSAQSAGLKLGDINQPLRVAVSGKAIGFGTYETLSLLGHERCLARIDRALAHSYFKSPGGQTMAKVWITYSWDDNKERDIDFIAQELRTAGLTVKMDRWNLGAGKRLWEQIENYIVNPKETDAWLMVATNSSLQSKPCKEEFAYALDRALEKRGKDYPIIAVFLGPVEDSLIPAGIKTRLFVSVTDPDWKERIIAAVEGRNPHISPLDVEPYSLKVHRNVGGPKPFAIEIRPRAGVWAPFFAAVPFQEKETVDPNIMIGPRDVPKSGGMLLETGVGQSDDKNWWIVFAGNQANPTTSYYVWCRSLPSQLAFGVFGRQPQYLVDINKLRVS